MDKILDPGVLVIIFLFGAPVFAVVGYYVYKILKMRSENDLKRAMVEQGMSVEEIERVLAAGGKSEIDDDD